MSLYSDVCWAIVVDAFRSTVSWIASWIESDPLELIDGRSVAAIASTIPGFAAAIYIYLLPLTVLLHIDPLMSEECRFPLVHP